MRAVGQETADSARGARALEFIAYYLDRIEQHLERIANAAEGGTPRDPELAEIRRQKEIGGKGGY